MTITRLTIMALLLVLICGCQDPKYVSAWPQIELGMTPEQVRSLLGEPMSVLAAQKIEKISGKTNEVVQEMAKAFGQIIVQGIFDLGYERWTYGNAGFIRPSTTSFCVYFGEDHRVIGYCRPTEGRYAKMTKPDVVPPTKTMPWCQPTNAPYSSPAAGSKR